MRSMNSDQVGMSVDSMPINDSGNYAVFQLLGDPETSTRSSLPKALSPTARTLVPAAATLAS